MSEEQVSSHVARDKNDGRVPGLSALMAPDCAVLAESTSPACGATDEL